LSTDPSPDPGRAPDPLEDGIRAAIRYYGFRTGAWVARRLPPAVGRAGAWVGGSVAYRLAKGKRAVVERNIGRVVGHGPERDRVVLGAFRFYARYWFDVLRLGGIGEAELDAVETAGLDQLDAALARGRGVVVVTPHFGSYDVAVAWLGHRGYRFNTAAEVLRPRALFEWFVSQRRAVTVVPSEPGAVARRRLTRALQRGEGVALPAERDLARRGVWVEFFGERTTFPAGPAALAVHTGAALLWGAMFFDGAGYRLEFGEIPYEATGDLRRDIEAATRRIAPALEAVVRRAPDQWHLFMPNWPSDEPGLPERAGRPESLEQGAGGVS
jgi:phosphatidylinositol dimannoside acyltransferase